MPPGCSSQVPLDTAVLQEVVLAAVGFVEDAAKRRAGGAVAQVNRGWGVGVQGRGFGGWVLGQGGGG